MDEGLKEELRRLGAEVRPESELPAEARELITRYAPGVPARGRVGVEFGRLADEQVYVYEDERLCLTVPVPTLEVFEGLVRELERLSDAADVDAYVSALARAFGLLFRGTEGNGSAVYDDELKLLAREVPRADVALTSVREALFGLVESVAGKRGSGRTARYCGLTEAVVDVAARFGARPADVLTWNAAEFFATWEALCNVAREGEAAAEEARKRWRRT
jgi:hypothetical protein